MPPKRDANKNTKDNSENDVPNLNDDLQKFIENTINLAVGNLVREIKILQTKVQELTEKNSELTNAVRINNDKCAKCLMDLNPVDKDLNLSSNSFTSGDTIIENSSKMTYSKKVQQVPKPDNRGEEDHSSIQRMSSNEGGRNRVIIGTNQETGSSPDEIFEAPTPKLWLYVGRCKPDTTESKISNYLKKRLPSHEFEILKLTTKGVNASFRLAADMNLYDQLYKPDFWPERVVIKKFIFRKNSKLDGGDFL